MKGVGRPTYDSNGYKFLAGVVVNISEEVKEVTPFKKLSKNLNITMKVVRSRNIGKYGFWKWNVDKNELSFRIIFSDFLE